MANRGWSSSRPPRHQLQRQDALLELPHLRGQFLVRFDQHWYQLGIVQPVAILLVP